MRRGSLFVPRSMRMSKEWLEDSRYHPSLDYALPVGYTDVEASQLQFLSEVRHKACLIANQVTVVLVRNIGHSLHLLPPFFLGRLNIFREHLTHDGGGVNIQSLFSNLDNFPKLYVMISPCSMIRNRPLIVVGGGATG